MNLVDVIKLNHLHYINKTTITSAEFAEFSNKSQTEFGPISTPKEEYVTLS